MGVKRLLSYVEGQCPDAFEHVDLRRLADQYYRRYNTKPQLLIDCNGYIRNIYGRLEFGLGGQWLQYLENIKVFVKYFQNAGFELLVMFDGVVEKKKMKRWLDRRKDERKIVSKIFDDIKRSGQHPDHKLFHIPTSLSGLTRMALKGLGVTVCSSSIEVDRELYLHCKENQSFGIISRDTDFMIYDVPQMFYMTCSNGHVKEVQLFRRDILCHHLGIPPQLLPLFACLLGCDTVSFQMLSNFHQRVTSGKRDPLVPSVAGYIRSLQLKDLSKISLHSVAKDIGSAFQDDYLYECVQDYACENQEENDVPYYSDAADLARAPVELTGTSKINQSVMDKIRSYHRNLDITDFVLPVITHQEYRSNKTMDDDTDTSMPSSGLVYRPIRQRLYGILLQLHVIARGVDPPSCGPVNAEGRPVQFGTVEEMCAYAGNAMNAPDVVQGMPLDIAPHPRLEDLWVDDTTTDVQRLRLKVFFSCMHCTKLLEDGILDAIPDRHILLCCILHFLLLHAPESTLRSCDVDAFVAQAICFQSHRPASLERLKVPRVSPRAVHLAAIFVRGLTTGLCTNSTCCLPFQMESLMPWYTFDGKLFHIKYLAAENGSTLHQLCDNKPRAVEMCHKMRDWIVKGTRLQSN
ncbi:constitutive coactivator of peroxisome proliferator-activated receptor gamma isoform X2 [Strongylocentrotus purpuratus]|uniref:Constitutive coactivator of peroxisome proliferator-activated receptor gamma n=1 Tax=Strongylocentrotus purpuratus TaxID=7668 RepID=A0A7M7NC57_STRPU|nr:constitutive coactivator of peroxisome proliferator-activated receptor gamma isoform X2 [Strongylocentrotus purpuratus]